MKKLLIMLILIIVLFSFISGCTKTERDIPVDELSYEDVRSELEINELDEFDYDLEGFEVR